MASMKFTKGMYKIQAEKRMKEDSGVGYALRQLVQLENLMVMNEKQFRWFYERYSGHQLLGGDDDDINCMKLSILKDLLNDMCCLIDERGVYHYDKKEQAFECLSDRV